MWGSVWTTATSTQARNRREWGGKGGEGEREGESEGGREGLQQLFTGLSLTVDQELVEQCTCLLCYSINFCRFHFVIKTHTHTHKNIAKTTPHNKYLLYGTQEVSSTRSYQPNQYIYLVIPAQPVCQPGHTCLSIMSTRSYLLNQYVHHGLEVSPHKVIP